MANAKDLRRRIRSVKNTAQITKAMQMVSATKMRKAQNQALGGRPYSETLMTVLSRIKAEKLPTHHLLKPGDSSKVGVLLLTSDKGLCGALNANVVRKIQSEEFKDKDLVFYTVGKKGRDFIVRSDKTLEADFENHERVHEAQARSIRNLLVTDFKAGKIGEVYIVYPNFISTLRQEATVLKLLPIDPALLEQNINPDLVDSLEPKSRTKPNVVNAESGQTEFLFEPNLTALLEFSLLHLVDITIYQSLLETKASEHSARMMAMQNATQNASDLVDDLTLTYNQLRQENITRELLEITGAQAALE